jgi:cupin fold WbuC family metalloprotein
MSLVKFNPEVFYSDNSIVKVASHEIGYLKDQAMAQPRLRSRLCTHPDVENTLHEMLIVHTKETYVRPHMHINRSESFHVIEGEMDVILFDDLGQIQQVIGMAPYPSNKVFYYRLNQELFHSLIIRSDIAVFHEVTNGPFDPISTVFPDWAPEQKTENFGERLEQSVSQYHKSTISKNFDEK